MAIEGDGIHKENRRQITLHIATLHVYIFLLLLLPLQKPDNAAQSKRICGDAKKRGARLCVRLRVCVYVRVCGEGKASLD